MDNFKYKTIGQMCADGAVAGKRVLVRVDFNVPMENGKIVDGFRIDVALPTINFLKKNKAKLILISHAEDQQGQNVSLEALIPVLEQKLDQKVIFFAHKGGQDAVLNDLVEKAAQNLKEGEMLLCENLRLDQREKQNDMQFAKQLAGLADFYVNDAFSVSHRHHASVVALPLLLPHCAGLRFDQEVKNLSLAFTPDHPFLFILAGAKFATKLPLVKKFISLADNVFIGGALANDLFSLKGYVTGKSILSDQSSQFGQNEPLSISLSSILKNPKLVLPLDVVLETGATNKPDCLSDEDKILDAGPETISILKQKAEQAKFILWNGPLGSYENGFKETTLQLAQIIAEVTTKNGVKTIVGGGDTLASIRELSITDKFSFVSTAGGAMLDFLAKGTLPGIEALS